MIEEVYGVMPYVGRDRSMGAGKLKIGKPVVFREDMYSLLFISVVKPIYKKFCEEKYERDLKKSLHISKEEEIENETSEDNIVTQSDEDDDLSVPLETLFSE